MEKLAVISFLFCFVSLGSAEGPWVGRSGRDVPTQFPSRPNEDDLDKNVSNLLFGDCNITSCNPVNYRHCYEDKVPQLIIHGVLLILGCVFAYLGYRLFKYTLFAIGALFGGMIAFYVIYNFLDNEDHVFYISLGVAAVVGIICGVLVVILYYIGIFLAGAALGGIAIWFLLSIIHVDYLQEHRWVPILILLIVAITFGVIALFVQKWFLIFSTPVIGGLLVTVAIDYFLELGRMMQYAFNVLRHVPDKPNCWYSWAILSVLGVVIITGIPVQLFVTARKYDHKKDTNGWFCFGLCKKKDESIDGDGNIEMRPQHGRYRRLREQSDE